MWHDWYSMLVDTAVTSSLRSAVAAAAVAAVLAAARVRSGSVRHAAWTVVLAAMLLMPILSRVAPAIEIPLAWTGASDIARGNALIKLPPSSGLDTPEGSSGATPPVTRAAPAKGPSDAEADEGVMVGHVAVARSSAGEFWSLLVAAAYSSGLLFLLARLLVGWILMRRVVRTSLAIGDAPAAMGLPVRESSRIATPVTAGSFRPRILLPSIWRTWPEETLLAVLAHEAAHVRRRDPLIATVACLNRAVFWFNPLGWWLQRTLAKCAEEACDDAALRTVRTPRRYVELLLDMADSVRSRRGRVAWSGVGVEGTGLLGQRIDRILRGEVCGEVSLARKLIVGVGCAVAITLAVACRQSPPQPPPLEPDPKVADTIAKSIAATEFESRARRLTAGQVADLEASLQKNPEDATTRRTLQLFYQDSAQTATVSNETVAARRRHILWAIEHHPDDDAMLRWGPFSPAQDPAGYEQARQLWLAWASKKDAAPDVLSNAARFFETTDRALAEQLLLRLEAMDPDGPTPRMKGHVYRPAWSWRIGELYAKALLGVSEWTGRAYKTSPEVARSPFAVDAYTKLETTKDTGVLRGAAGALGWMRLPFPPGAPAGESGMDPQATAASYLERVLQLEPGNEVVRKDLDTLRWNQRFRPFWDSVRVAPRDTWSAIAAALPDAERFERLPWFVDAAFQEAQYQELKKHDAAAAKASRDEARHYADDLLALCDARPNDPRRSVGHFLAHIAFAALALHDNDTAAAVRHLDDAVNVPPGAKVTAGFNSRWDDVAVDLLNRGERESVARFLERASALTEPWLRDRLITAVAAIRAGRMPEFYQNKVTPRPWDR